MRKGDKNLVIRSDGLGSREKRRIERFALNLVELVAKGQALQGPLEQAFRIFDAG
jgi:hypothetical protein